MLTYFDKDFFKFLGGFVAILALSLFIFWATSGLRGAEQSAAPASNLPDQYQSGYKGQ